MFKWIIAIEALLGFIAYYSHLIVSEKVSTMASSYNNQSIKADAFFASVVQVGAGVLFLSIGVAYIAWAIVDARRS